MGELAVQFEDVGKRYRLGEHLGGLSELVDFATDRVRRRNPSQIEARYLWALRDINLDIAAGQSLGIVGRNGAGKSTFLKVVAGVTTPTTGVCRTRGRIGSLLEVGTGFHDDLTGRENIYLSGAIMGMPRVEVKRQLDEIVDFAGLEGFLDTPVKRYSSGMYLRLAFGVAAHLDADILLVDEVLAVGDAEFRRKCLQKMSDVEAGGRTVLFASHNLDALTEFCKMAIWIDGGEIVAHGPSGNVVRQYLSASAGPGLVAEFDSDDEAAASLLTAAVLDAAAVPQATLTMGSDVIIELEVHVSQPTPAVDIGLVVQRINGTVLFDENLGADGRSGLNQSGRHRVRMTIPPVLTPADYRVSVWIGTAYDDLEFHEHVLAFAVEGDDADRSDRLINLGAPWTTDLIESHS